MSSSLVFYLVFRDKASLWTQGSLTALARLACQYIPRILLYLLHISYTWTAGESLHAEHLCGFCGSKLWSSDLHRRNLPTEQPSNSFIIHFTIIMPTSLLVSLTTPIVYIISKIWKCFSILNFLSHNMINKTRRYIFVQ